MTREVREKEARSKEQTRSPFFKAVAVTLSLFVTTSAFSAPKMDESKVRKELDAWLQPFIDNNVMKGLAVGIVFPSKTIFAGYGRARDKVDARPGPDSTFQIASVTKTFTTLLLADLVREGWVTLNDPVQKYLPNGTVLPDWEGRQITLLDLATHTSGLSAINRSGGKLSPKWYSPRLWKMLIMYKLTGVANVAGGMDVDDMYVIASKMKLKARPGTSWEYSNVGMALLGHSLASAAGDLSYEEQIRDRITKRLGMDHTWFVLPENIKGTLVDGHNAAGKKTGDWNLGPINPAGGLRSSVGDLMKYVKLQLGQIDDRLAKSVTIQQKIHRRIRHVDDPPRALSLGWHFDTEFNMYYHSGTGQGTHNWVGFNREKGIGVIVLSNSAVMEVEDIGGALLKKLCGYNVELPEPNIAIALSGEALKQYEGTYVFDPDKPKARFIIKAKGKALSATFMNSGNTSTLWPKSESSFFCKEWDCRVNFIKDDSGKVVRADVKMYYNSYPALKEASQ